MAQPDPHGGGQGRSGEGYPAQQSESHTGPKRRRLSVDSDYYKQVQILGPGDYSSEEEEEEEEEEEDDDNDKEDSVDGPGRHRKELKSFKHFVQELEDDVLPNEAKRRYSLYIESQKRAYFEAHQTEEWLRNKYHPSNLMAIVEKKKRNARDSAREFSRELVRLKPETGRCSTSEGTDSLLVSSEDESTADSSLETRRLLLHIAQTQALTLKLDNEKGISNNVLWPKNNDIHPVVKRLEGHDLLVHLLHYLWSVHGVSYYGMRESEEAVALTDDYDPSYDDDGWDEELHSFWQLRLKGEDPLKRRAAIKDIEAAVDKALDCYVVKVEEKSMGLIYGCGFIKCSRPFNGVEFVREHLRTRHPLLVTSLKTQLEGQFYYKNYMRDPKAPVGLHNDEDVQPSPVHRDIALGLPAKSSQDESPRENSNNAVATAEDDSSNHSAS